MASCRFIRFLSFSLSLSLSLSLVSTSLALCVCVCIGLLQADGASSLPHAGRAGP